MTIQSPGAWRRSRANGASMAAIGLALLFAIEPAWAQDAGAGPTSSESAVEAEAAAVPAEGQASDEQIVVTGSRIARSGFTAPTPVTVVGEEQIARQGAANIAQILNEIPAFRPQSTPATTAIFVSNLGASTADLRGLGSNRTLVLIDGRRVVASTVAGGNFSTPANAVDLNLVPASLLQRVEVVTGGASAVYGSDAVAGVTNLIINRNLTGIRTTMQFGMAEAGDNEEFLVSLAYGTRWGGDRGRFVIGAEYVDNSGTGDCYTRDWCASSANIVTNPFVAGSTNRVIGGAGQPANLILPNTRTATASINGLIVAGPLRGTEFNADGTTFQHNYGTYGGVGLFQSGGGDPVLPFYQFFPLSAQSERFNSFANVDYDVSDDLNLFLQGSFGHVEGTILGASRRDVAPPGSYQIQRDNAFLPPAVLARMIATGAQTLPYGRIWNDIGPQVGDVERETYRIVAGFNWAIGDTLKLDGYYQYGQTDYSQRGYNTTVNSRMTRAIDSVMTAAGPVCRVNADANPNNNDPACVPLNPFGNNASSQAARDYVTETAMQDSSLKQHVAALTLRGDLVDLWAGPLAFAAGVEYREDRVSSTIDAISAANDFHTSPGGGIVGGKADLNVKEGFLELALPLARDMPFIRSAELTGAVRVTDYSNSGQVETWKIGAEWEPFSWLRLRGTRSRDVRAPNVFELYGAPQSSFQAILDPANNNANVLVPTLLGGNPNLEPEIAKTWTAGAVLTGDFGSAGILRFSADWFDISLDGAVATLGGQVIVTRCFTGVTELCSLIDRAGGTPNGALQQVRNFNLNLNTLITRGWDFEAQYGLPLSSLADGWNGRLDFRVLATFVKDLITIDSVGVATDRAGMNGSAVSAPSGLPDYTINGYITYQGDPLSLQLQVRHISNGIYNVAYVGPDEPGYNPAAAIIQPGNRTTINDNHVGGVTYVNLNGQYTIWAEGERRVELFGVVNNLFDKDPPNDLPSSFGPTNNVLYDVVGRSYRGGVRFNF